MQSKRCRICKGFICLVPGNKVKYGTCLACREREKKVLAHKKEVTR